MSTKPKPGDVIAFKQTGLVVNAITRDDKGAEIAVPLLWADSDLGRELGVKWASLATAALAIRLRTSALDTKQ